MTKRKYGGIEEPPLRGQPEENPSMRELHELIRELQTQHQRLYGHIRRETLSLKEREVEKRLQRRIDRLQDDLRDMVAAFHLRNGRNRWGSGWEDELAKAVARDKLSQEDAATAKKLIADALASRDATLARSSKKTKTGSGLAGDAWDALRGLWDALRAILNPVESLEALFSHVIEYEPLNDQVGEGAHASRLPAKLPKLSPAQLEFLRDAVLGSAQRVHQARKVSRVKAKRQLHSHLKPKAASNLYYLPSSRALHR
jgi:hypothetical protein